MDALPPYLERTHERKKHEKQKRSLPFIIITDREVSLFSPPWGFVTWQGKRARKV